MLCSFWFVCFFGLSACLSRVCLVRERLLCCARFGPCAFSVCPRVCPRVCLVCVFGSCAFFLCGARFDSCAFFGLCSFWFVRFIGLSAHLYCVCLARASLLGLCSLSLSLSLSLTHTHTHTERERETKRERDAPP